MATSTSPPKSQATRQKISWIKKSIGTTSPTAVGSLLGAAARGDSFAVSQTLDEHKGKGLTVRSTDQVSRLASTAVRMCGPWHVAPLSSVANCSLLLRR